ncbi:MAG: hypothetical protein D6761_04890 [Candidatus Dadabacteria bacterium]|nr:MAG: hypothetical protein D6761_04890 [Candidatus Dadabacteria bacterium]
MRRFPALLALLPFTLATAPAAADDAATIEWMHEVAPFRELRDRKDAPVPTDAEIRAALGGEIVARRGEIPGTSLDYVWAARVLDVDPKLFWLAIIDREHYEQLSDNIVESIITEQQPDRFFSYNVLEAPLVSTRHQVLECFANRELYEASDGKIWEHYWHRASDVEKRIAEALQSPKLERIGPEDVEKAVIVAHNDGSWMLIPLPDGRLWAETYSANDPGGSIPDFIVRKVAASSTEKTLKSYEAWTRRQARIHFGAAHPDVLAPDGTWVKPAAFINGSPAFAPQPTTGGQAGSGTGAHGDQ